MVPKSVRQLTVTLLLCLLVVIRLFYFHVRHSFLARHTLNSTAVDDSLFYHQIAVVRLDKHVSLVPLLRPLLWSPEC